MQMLVEKHASEVASMESRFEEERSKLRREAADLAKDAVLSSEEKANNSSHAKCEHCKS
jgi:hypothetical protein